MKIIPAAKRPTPSEPFSPPASPMEAIRRRLEEVPPPLREEIEKKLLARQNTKVKCRIFKLISDGEQAEINEFLNREDITVASSNGRFFDDGSYRLILFYQETQKPS